MSTQDQHLGRLYFFGAGRPGSIEVFPERGEQSVVADLRSPQALLFKILQERLENETALPVGLRGFMSRRELAEAARVARSEAAASQDEAISAMLFRLKRRQVQHLGPDDA